MLHRVRKEVLALEAYSAGGPRPGLRLDANESPFAPPSSFYAQLMRQIAGYGLNRYPDPTGLRVRDALAKRLGGTAEQYLLGNGSDELILLLPALFEPAPIAFLDPSFAMYRVAALTHGHEPLPIPLREDFSIDEQATFALLAQTRPALFYLASPNNPTNNAFDTALITKLVAAAPDTLFVIDEAYGPYNEWTSHRVFPAARNIAVLGTISKIGFAGLRLGWLRLTEQLSSQLNKLRSPYNTGVPAQMGAALFLEDYWEEAHKNVDVVVNQRTRLEKELVARGYVFAQSRSNSLLVDCGAHRDTVRSALLENDVYVRWFSHPTLARHFRVSIGSSEENDHFLRALPSLAPC